MAARKRKTVSRQTHEHVAHHEAGHFVAAYFQRTHGDTFEITIAPRGDAAGHVEGELWLSPEPSQSEIERKIIELFAGYAAEVRFDPSRTEHAHATASHDDEQASMLLGWLHATDVRAEELRTFAKSIVAERWYAVTALAAELLVHITLESCEAEWIVAIAEGRHAEIELPAYRRSREAFRARG